MSAVLSQTDPATNGAAAIPSVHLAGINCCVFVVNGDLVLEAASSAELDCLVKQARPADAVILNDEPVSTRRMFFSNECGQGYGLIRTMLRKLGVPEGDIRQIATLLPPGEIQPDILDPRHRLRLQSRDLISAHGIVRWAKAGYEVETARRGPVGPFIAVLADGYALGPILAEKVLRGEVAVVDEGDSVVLLLDDQQLRDHLTRQSDLKSRPGGATIEI